MIKDRNGKDLIEAQVIKRGGKNMQKNSIKKYLNDPDTHDGVMLTQSLSLWSLKSSAFLGSITADKSGADDGISGDLFQILKDDDVKLLHSVFQQNWKTQQGPQDGKSSVFILIPKKTMTKNIQTIVLLIYHASKVILKILQARHQQYAN